ncbi:MAG: outer membrane beta-barrel protein [Cyclobacteriaceae bacterium]|jgi:outer membrane protein W|nr:outer membrane beta-barrel protein [Cyclobacteriaceae bacterium]
MKYFLSLVVVAFALSASAQDSTKNFKPSKGDFNTEVNFKPFGSNPISLSYLRFRYFFADNLAVRIGGLYTSNTNEPDESTKSKTSFFNFRPGIEYHYKGSNKLSPYIGFELDFATRTSKFEISGPISNPITVDNATDTNGSNRAFNRIGFNFVLGADFYIAPKIYFGTEFGYGFQQTNFLKIIQTSNANTIEAPESITKDFGLNFNSAIRLGYIF